jgi:hypothetical protein
METPPTEEELKKRQELRKEQGLKLKEIMQRKREEKRRKMEEELAVSCLILTLAIGPAVAGVSKGAERHGRLQG